MTTKPALAAPLLLDKAEAFREGWQCKVYLFRHHVVKVLKTKEEARQIIARERLDKSADIDQLVEKTLRDVRTSLELLELRKPPAHLTAHFEVISEGIFLQRRVERLAHTIARLSKQGEYAEVLLLLQRYLALVLDLWRYGIHDTSWKFNKNFGLTPQGELVLLDCLELSGDIEWVAADITQRRWINTRRISSVLPQPLIGIFTAMMEQLLTEEKLRQTWLTQRTNG
ncbi:MAG: hypothetical protein EPN21_09850 [Methylococcaceae bacterium]|nr:MAG: hypothetical protein EPN21_09850 [Methylococcaceae bacterium]